MIIRSFIVDGKETESYCLRPEEMIMVNTEFNDEINYIGLGKYKTAYEARMKRLQDTREDLENKRRNSV